MDSRQAGQSSSIFRRSRCRPTRRRDWRRAHRRARRRGGQSNDRRPAVGLGAHASVSRRARAWHRTQRGRVEMAYVQSVQPAAAAAGDGPLSGLAPPRADGVRIGLFNVKFSPNLGDGLLSECLEAELATACRASRSTVSISPGAAVTRRAPSRALRRSPPCTTVRGRCATRSPRRSSATACARRSRRAGAPRCAASTRSSSAAAICSATPISISR